MWFSGVGGKIWFYLATGGLVFCLIKDASGLACTQRPDITGPQLKGMKLFSRSHKAPKWESDAWKAMARAA